MSIVKLSSISQAASLLKSGEIVVYPTETAYALGACSTNYSTVSAVYDLKKRDGASPLALIAADIHQVEEYFFITAAQRSFAQHYWPGPLTLLLRPRNRTFGKYLNKTGDTVGVRVSSHPVARRLCQLVKAPLVATSANISGKGTPYSQAAIERNFKNSERTVYYIDSGTLTRKATSAVVEVTDNSINVIRWNPILRK